MPQLRSKILNTSTESKHNQRNKLWLLLSRSVVSDSLWPHGLPHARPPCPSPTPAVYSNPCPSSWWCHPTISSSVVPFSSRLPSFPASGSFPVSRLFASGGQMLGASASLLPVNVQGWFPLGWPGFGDTNSSCFSPPHLEYFIMTTLATPPSVVSMPPGIWPLCGFLAYLAVKLILLEMMFFSETWCCCGGKTQPWRHSR